MGMIDNKLIFSDGQDLTGSGDSTSHIDMGVARDLGAGEPMWLLLQFGTVVSNATLAAILVGDDDDGGTNAITVASLAAITPTSNTFVAVPIRVHKPKRYFKITYTMSGGSTPHIPTTATLVTDAEVKAHSAIY